MQRRRLVVELAIDPQQLALGTFCFRFVQARSLPALLQGRDLYFFGLAEGGQIIFT